MDKSDIVDIIKMGVKERTGPIYPIISGIWVRSDAISIQQCDIDNLKWVNKLPPIFETIRINFSCVNIGKDLIELKGLKKIDIRDTNIIGHSNLCYLKNIDSLTLRRSNVEDIDWAVDLDSTEMDIKMNDIKDMSPLLKMRKLKLAVLYDNKSSDWSFLPKDSEYKKAKNSIYFKNKYTKRLTTIVVQDNTIVNIRKLIDQRKLDFSDQMKSIQL